MNTQDLLTDTDLKAFQDEISGGIPEQLPPYPTESVGTPHAPKRLIENVLTVEEKRLAVANALRYFVPEHHAQLAVEFAAELNEWGRIYMFRFRPTYPMYARPIAEYPAQCQQAAAIMLMIQNNLDPNIAKYPHELITYGGNGAVFQNWAQYRLTMQYLSQMTEQQTLVLYSGHPLGLFPSHPDAPRVVLTNGMMIPNYSTKEDWNKYTALGVTSYGQMTAGSFMYIGPQGIVHGTTITLLNAARRSGIKDANLKGKLFVTSGLGGMSGAQTRAAEITGCVGLIAEIDPDAVQQRINDGYVLAKNVYQDIESLLERLSIEQGRGKGVALIYQGNIVELWEALVAHNIKIDLGSDQTSLHNIDDCGYCPAGFSFEEAKSLMYEDKTRFMAEVRATLRRHVAAINILTAKGMYFWDYGNAFLKEADEAGADIWLDEAKTLPRYKSYVEDIMGPLCFDYGFGPFRWVCASGDSADLAKTDAIAASVLSEMLLDAPDEIRQQLEDNLLWVREAQSNRLVVGSQARILYADAEGRMKIAAAFNQAIARHEISAPIILGRDHHDVSGTDSPFRETSNIYDGSKYTADMAVHNFVGDSFRGATWVSLHNGGGVGWGQVINGGFGLVLDGSPEAEQRLHAMLFWDVNNGIARRSWARNKEAIWTIERAMQTHPLLKVTVPQITAPSLLDNLF